MTRTYIGLDCDGLLDVMTDSTMANIRRQLVANGYWQRETKYDFAGRSLTYAEFYQQNYALLRAAMRALLLRLHAEAGEACTLVLATNRQDPTIDAVKQKENDTVLMEELIKEVRDDVLPGVAIDWTSLADLRVVSRESGELVGLPAISVFGEARLDEVALAEIRASEAYEVVALESGAAWLKDRSLTAPLDARKIELIKHQLQTFRAQHPGERLRYYFLDDDHGDRMIPAIRDYFKANPIEGVDLHLIKFDWQGIMFDRVFADAELLGSLRDGDIDALISQSHVSMSFAEAKDEAKEALGVEVESKAAAASPVVAAAQRGGLVVAASASAAADSGGSAAVAEPKSPRLGC